MILPIFGVEPPLKATTGRIRVIWGAGGQPIAWEGPLSLGEGGISQEIAKNKQLLKWVRTRCAENQREETSFQLNGAIEFYADSGALIQKENCSFFVSFDVAERPQGQLTQHELHLQGLEVLKEVKAATIAAIKDLNVASAQALNAVAAPLSEVSKALIKMVEGAQQKTAENAKETQDLLIQALTNRIIENDAARSKRPILEDIEAVSRLLPMLKGLLGEVETPGVAPLEPKTQSTGSSEPKLKS